MPKQHREKLCPEVTDPRKRMFLDVVPTIRRIQTDVLETQTLSGERIEIPAGEKNIAVYLHRAGSGIYPVVFEYHGGGYVFGSAEADDGFCEKLCRKGCAHVIGVDYSLAPECRYPGQIREAWDVIAWFREHAESYGIDSDRVAVTGFSAGANLAAAVALWAASERAEWLKAQILHYPFLDFQLDLDRAPGDAADIDPVVVNGFMESYCSEEERVLPLVSPVCADPGLLAHAAPALLIPAERDRLCAQAQEYAAKLQQAGTEAVCYIMPDAHHCYVEDACNPALYEKTTLPEKKKTHSPVFRERAEEAVQMTADFLEKSFHR